jgi:hypothetical protein
MNFCGNFHHCVVTEAAAAESLPSPPLVNFFLYLYWCRNDMDNGWNGTDLLNVKQVQARNRYVMKQMYNR